jgi:hypothetical protein
LLFESLDFTDEDFLFSKVSAHLRTVKVQLELWGVFSGSTFFRIFREPDPMNVLGQKQPADACKVGKHPFLLNFSMNYGQ